MAQIYKVGIDSTHIDIHHSKVETFTIKAMCEEAAIIIALAKWLDAENLVDIHDIAECSQFTQVDIFEYVLALRFDDTLITPGSDGQSAEIAAQIAEQEQVGFIYGDWEGKITCVDQVETISELILEEVFKEVRKRFPTAYLDSEQIIVPLKPLGLEMEIKRGKLHITLDPTSRIEIGTMDLANPKFPTNVLRSIFAMIENFTKTDSLLGQEHDY